MIHRLLHAAPLLALLAAGCAADAPPVPLEAAGSPSSPQDLPPALLQERLGRLEREVAALREQVDAMRPGHERILAIESDIRALLDQLSQVPGRAASPRPPPPPAARPTASRPAPPGPATPQPANPQPADPLDPASAAGFGVHLASYREAVQVAEGWQELQRRLGADLSGLSPRVVGIDFGDGRGTFYRLKAGPLKSRAAAEELCRKLRAKADFCQAGDFAGTPGEDFWRSPPGAP